MKHPAQSRRSHRGRPRSWKKVAPSSERPWTLVPSLAWLWETWPRGGALLSSQHMKDTVRGWAQPLAATLADYGIRANTLTILGLLLNILAAMLLSVGHFTAGGLVFLVFNAFDFLDGAVARLTGTASEFGAFLDSVVDRYSEAVVFLGLSSWYMVEGHPLGAVATYAAMVGSLMVSYTRARAEGLGYACEVGLLPRPERIVLLGLGLIVSGVLEAPTLFFYILVALAVLTNLTALQRILYMRRATQPKE